MKSYKAGPGQAGKRLDVVLSAFAPELSRSAWQNLIKQSKVEVNKSAVTNPSKIISDGDELTVTIPQLPDVQAKVEVIYQDDDVVVYNKPSGLLTHAKGDLVEEWTLAEIAKPLVDDDGSNRPGIVHRLDRGTSGVIVVAKNKTAKVYLQRQFAKRLVKKTYIAIVHGHLDEKEFTIDLPLKRDLKNPGRFAPYQHGKPAQTEVKVLKSNKDFSLLELRPKTGRTHQLRVHLLYIGHPIVGDSLYGKTANKHTRMFLHASRLELSLPIGKEREFESPLPADFKKGIRDHGLA